MNVFTPFLHPLHHYIQQHIKIEFQDRQLSMAF